MRAVPRPLTEPWLISAAGKELVFGIWSRGELYQERISKALVAATADAAEDEPLKYSRATRIDAGIAIIPIDGPLFRKAGLFSEISGATSYDQIRKDMRLALADPLVRGILFEVNSPGGEANGCSELADEIFAARSKKMIWAYVSGAGQSAACWLFTAAERAVCSDTALLGCIGVRQSVVDTSKSDENAGIKVHDLVNDESPEKRDYPVDDQVLAKQQRQINALFQVFKSAVARNRGVTGEDVVAKFGAGDSLVGQDAVDAGLADEIGNLEGAIAGLRAELDAGDRQKMYGAAANAGVPLNKQQIAAEFEVGARKPAPLNKEKPMAKIPPTSAPAVPALASASEPEKEPKDEKDKKESKAGEMKKCGDCDGEGEKDGEKCKSCDGEGEVPAAKAKAEEKKPDEDKKPEGKAADEEDEKKALASLAGVGPGASLRSIRAALEAKTVPLTAQAKLQTQVAELEKKLADREKSERTAAAKVYAAKAVEDGRTTEEKRPRVEAEHAEKGEKAAEELLFPAGTFSMLRRFSDGKGDPIGKKTVAQNFAQADTDEIEKAMLDKSKEIAARDKISTSLAMDKVKIEAPEIYAAYASIRK